MMGTIRRKQVRASTSTAGFREQRLCHLDGTELRVELRGKFRKRRLFLEDLGKALVRPQIKERQLFHRTPASAAIVRSVQEENAGALSVNLHYTADQ
ncbi:unnamed protein product [Anisakis simplex]|uniref:TilS_C domain-containing protein n=1 Tax=Anisakis simplex TaxID=6269 RepID=A0A0M3J3C5_ANISI|nr:unnamed protein product [Anisakis simplex]